MSALSQPSEDRFAKDDTDAVVLRKFLDARNTAVSPKEGTKTGRKYTQRLLVSGDNKTKLVVHEKLGKSFGTFMLERNAKSGKGAASMKELAKTFKAIVSEPGKEKIKEGYEHLATDIYQFLIDYNNQKKTSKSQQVEDGVMKFFAENIQELRNRNEAVTKSKALAQNKGAAPSTSARELHPSALLQSTPPEPGKLTAAIGAISKFTDAALRILSPAPQPKPKELTPDEELQLLNKVGAGQKSQKEAERSKEPKPGELSGDAYTAAIQKQMEAHSAIEKTYRRASQEDVASSGLQELSPEAQKRKNLFDSIIPDLRAWKDQLSVSQKQQYERLEALLRDPENFDPEKYHEVLTARSSSTEPSLYNVALTLNDHQTIRNLLLPLDNISRLAKMKEILPAWFKEKNSDTTLMLLNLAKPKERLELLRLFQNRGAKNANSFLEFLLANKPELAGLFIHEVLKEPGLEAKDKVAKFLETLQKKGLSTTEIAQLLTTEDDEGLTAFDDLGVDPRPLMQKVFGKEQGQAINQQIREILTLTPTGDRQGSSVKPSSRPVTPVPVEVRRIVQELVFGKGSVDDPVYEKFQYCIDNAGTDTAYHALVESIDNGPSLRDRLLSRERDTPHLMEFFEHVVPTRNHHTFFEEASTKVFKALQDDPTARAYRSAAGQLFDRQYPNPVENFRELAKTSPFAAFQMAQRVQLLRPSYANLMPTFSVEFDQALKGNPNFAAVMTTLTRNFKTFNTDDPICEKFLQCVKYAGTNDAYDSLTIPIKESGQSLLDLLLLNPESGGGPDLVAFLSFVVPQDKLTDKHVQLFEQASNIVFKALHNDPSIPGHKNAARQLFAKQYPEPAVQFSTLLTNAPLAASDMVQRALLLGPSHDHLMPKFLDALNNPELTSEKIDDILTTKDDITKLTMLDAFLRSSGIKNSEKMVPTLLQLTSKIAIAHVNDTGGYERCAALLALASRANDQKLVKDFMSHVKEQFTSSVDNVNKKGNYERCAALLALAYSANDLEQVKDFITYATTKLTDEQINELLTTKAEGEKTLLDLAKTSADTINEKGNYERCTAFLALVRKTPKQVNQFLEHVTAQFASSVDQREKEGNYERGAALLALVYSTDDPELVKSLVTYAERSLTSKQRMRTLLTTQIDGGKTALELAKALTNTEIRGLIISAYEEPALQPVTTVETPKAPTHALLSKLLRADKAQMDIYDAIFGADGKKASADAKKAALDLLKRFIQNENYGNAAFVLYLTQKHEPAIDQELNDHLKGTSSDVQRNIMTKNKLFTAIIDNNTEGAKKFFTNSIIQGAENATFMLNVAHKHNPNLATDLHAISGKYKETVMNKIEKALYHNWIKDQFSQAIHESPPVKATNLFHMACSTKDEKLLTDLIYQLRTLAKEKTQTRAGVPTLEQVQKILLTEDEKGITPLDHLHTLKKSNLMRDILFLSEELVGAYFLRLLTVKKPDYERIADVLRRACEMGDEVQYATMLKQKLDDNPTMRKHVFGLTSGDYKFATTTPPKTIGAMLDDYLSQAKE